MIMPPYHGATFRVPEKAIFDFYRTVSDAIDIPIMIQDAPVAGTPLSVDLLARMAREIANVSYFKIEVPMAAASCATSSHWRRRIEGPWDGEEAITLMADLDAGATGAMTGGGYPDGIRQIVDPYLAGRREEALAAYARWLPLINYENRQCGLQAAKMLMQEGGVIGSAAVVIPCKRSTRRRVRASLRSPASSIPGAALGKITGRLRTTGKVRLTQPPYSGNAMSAMTEMVRIRAGLAIGPGRADRQIARGINPVQPHHRQSSRKPPQPGSDRAESARAHPSPTSLRTSRFSLGKSRQASGGPGWRRLPSRLQARCRCYATRLPT